MKFTSYLKDKIILILTYIFILILVFLILLVFDLYYTGIILVMFLLILPCLFLFFYRFYKKKKFYDEIYFILDKLDDKVLIHETIDNPNFLEGDLLLDILRIIDKYKLEEINKYKKLIEDFKEFMEMWVHEIKTPLAVCNLICENNQNRVTDSISEEVLKMDNLVELILFYAKSKMAFKDYIVKSSSLKDIVNKVILKNKKSFLEKKIKLDIHDLDYLVKTDSKWMEFIINQIISNSIKYIKDNPLIEIYALENKENVSLIIKDNGIGINSKDVPLVFEKGFTGQNGRSKYNSTGMGLYLVKKLSDNLGNDVLIESVLNEGTTLKIIFPVSSFTDDILGG